MSRINDLLRELQGKEPVLAKELEVEVNALSERRAFGLNFERHVPELIELPARRVRKGDKVRILNPRTNIVGASDSRPWRVLAIDRETLKATIEIIDPAHDRKSTGQSSAEIRKVTVEDLVVVAEFRDPIYPGLTRTGEINYGVNRPHHLIINAENYHALQALLYTHEGCVDAIYIDPPYNTGAKDWKYNNDFVESDDLYRHSKWLAFIERRMLLAKRLLNPNDSILIVSIDEKEYLRLGLLLEQVFPESRIQMASTITNPKGVIRFNELTRTNEFLFFVPIGAFKFVPEQNLVAATEKVRWASLRRMDIESRRGSPKGGQNQFYPIFVSNDSGRIEAIGEPLPPSIPRDSILARPGCSTIWPLRPDGTEMNWGLTPDSLRRRLAEGYVKVARGRERKSFTVYYLTSGQIEDIGAGKMLITGRDVDGSVNVKFVGGKSRLPSTQWDRESHNAQSHGTGLLNTLIPGRKFPFPKSLYAVEDCLRLAVGQKPNAVILDFFAGSGTTAHAVARLNTQDNGTRQAICVTNNEVAPEEQRNLRASGLRPGDLEWERQGICERILKPRIEAAFTGQLSSGEALSGEYKFTNPIPFSAGLDQSAVFFNLTYESPLRIASNRDFSKIAYLLWVRAGACGNVILNLEDGWAVAERYCVLENIDKSKELLNAVANNRMIRAAFIISDDDILFELISQSMPDHIEPIRLYESYLRNFEIESGRGMF